MCITKVPLPFSVYYGNVLSFFGAIEDPTVESSVKYADKMGESAISGFICCQGIASRGYGGPTGKYKCC